MAADVSGGKTLWVVEDNEIAREGLTAVLQREGYTVVMVQDGKAALNLLVHDPAPDLILLDMMLPIMDGWDFLRRRKREPVLAAVPVVITTGLGIASSEWATSLGAAGLLRKPLDTVPLLAEIRRCLTQ